MEEFAGITGTHALIIQVTARQTKAPMEREHYIVGPCLAAATGNIHGIISKQLSDQPHFFSIYPPK